MSFPLFDVHRFIFAQIDGDSALETALGGSGRIWEHPAPLDADYPFVTIDHVGAGDRRGVDRARHLTHALFMVRVVDRDKHSIAELETAADRIDVLLDGAGGALGDASQISLSREAITDVSEIDGSSRILHLIQHYRVFFHDV